MKKKETAYIKYQMETETLQEINIQSDKTIHELTDLMMDLIAEKTINYGSAIGMLECLVSSVMDFNDSKQIVQEKINSYYSEFERKQNESSSISGYRLSK